MKGIFAVAALAVGANALVGRSNGCCFHLSVTGDVSGSLGQLGDGQSRVGDNSLSPSQFCIDSNGAVTDSAGRGCIITNETTQFQCDEGSSGTIGFSVSQQGELEYHGNPNFIACETGQNGGRNIYTTNSTSVTMCKNVQMKADTCPGTGSSGGPGQPGGGGPVSTTTVMSTVTVTGSCDCPNTGLPAPGTAAPGGGTGGGGGSQPSGPAGGGGGSPQPSMGGGGGGGSPQPSMGGGGGSPKPSAGGGSGGTAPVIPIIGGGGTPPSVPSGKPSGPAGTGQPASPSGTPGGGKPGGGGGAVGGGGGGSSQPAASHSQTPGGGGGGSGPSSTAHPSGPGGAPHSTSSIAIPSTSAVPVQSSSSVVIPSSSSVLVPSSSSAKPSSTQSSGGACVTTLAKDKSNYQYPHLVVPINSSSPDTEYGTQYFATISTHSSVLFNFDIPESYSGKSCNLVFLFPKKEDLETSDYTFSGDGKIDIAQLSSVASNSTTYHNAPSVSKDYGDITISPGHSYVVNTFSCPAGQTVGYQIKDAGSTYLHFFQDWNPSPLGLYITAC